MNITRQEKDILRHALGLSRPDASHSEAYRNYFFTGPGTDEYPICEKLVDKGMMQKRIYPLKEMSISYIYQVTDEGIKEATDK